MLTAEYEGQITTRNASGVWHVEHQLRRGAEALLACKYLQYPPDPRKFLPRGSTVLVRRMAAGLVQIVSEV